MSEIKSILVPFDKNGNMLDYNGWNVHEMREVSTFQGTLRYQSYSKGRSAVGFTFLDENEKSYNMFLSSMDDAIPHLNQGRLTGTFQFVKRGTAYGIVLIGPSFA